MGNRDYKQFGKDAYYHIYNRGNAKQGVFLDDEDFSFFLLRLEQNLFPAKHPNSRLRPLPENSFSLVSYCLMPNHFHFLLRQNTDIQTSQLILRVCTSYSKYFNKKYHRVGHIFQDQFQQALVQDNSYLLWLSAYMHQNPTVAGFVPHPSQYQWSSYAEFQSATSKILCDTAIILDQFKDFREYENFVEESLEAIKERKDLKRFLLDFE